MAQATSQSKDVSKSYHIIITGASRGIGKALAGVLAAESGDIILHLIARSSLSDVMEELSKRGTQVFTYRFDLSRTDGIEVLTGELFSNITDTSVSVALVNNAGMLAPIGPIGKHDTETYRTNLEVNFVAPALLCQEFIKRTAGFSGHRQILNVSSGAALNPYYGWSHYCSTKAGLDMLTKCVALEHGNALSVHGFNPGRTDTKMQNEIREQSTDDFRHVDNFVEAYEKGALNAPEDVARMMGQVLLNEKTRNRFQNGSNISVRDFM